MSISHRTNRLKLVGTPAVEQLHNGRYQLIINCTAMNSREDWYSANKARIFPDFGSLQSAEMSIDGLAPRTGEAYADMRLVSVQSITRGEKYIVTLVYQTLGDSFVQESADKVDQELNGLRRVTRSLIAKDGASYGKTVGTSTISHTEHGYDTTTLTLASAVEDAKQANEGGYVRIVETWVEPGTLSVSSRNLSEGVKEVTTTFLATEGSTTGPVVRRTKENFEGLQTISVTTLQDRAGNSIIGTDPNLVHSYERLVDFKFPGVVSIDNESDSASGITVLHYFYDIQPPVTEKVEAQVNVFFQTESNIVPADFTYGGSQELWNPTSWAEGKIAGLGCNFALTSARPLSETKAFVGYAAGTPNSQTVIGGTGSNVKAIEGNYIAPSSSASIEVSGGPGTPSGKYVLDVQLSPAFEDVDGNIYFKKTIVTATV